MKKSILISTHHGATHLYQKCIKSDLWVQRFGSGLMGHAKMTSEQYITPLSAGDNEIDEKLHY